jgi:hypothetical protein
VNIINQVFSLLSGAATWTKALRYPQEYGQAAGGATAKLKELQKTILGFDEINKLNKQSDNGSGGGIGGLDYSKMFEESQYEGVFANLKDFVQRHLQEIEMILAEGGLTFDQVDYLLYLETCIADGSITDEQKREIICRDF